MIDCSTTITLRAKHTYLYKKPEGKEVQELHVYEETGKCLRIYDTKDGSCKWVEKADAETNFLIIEDITPQPSASDLDFKKKHGFLKRIFCN